MKTTLRWIGSLSSALQEGLDRAVSAELHAITSDIYRSKIVAKTALGRTGPASVHDLVETAASEARSTSPEKMAA